MKEFSDRRLTPEIAQQQPDALELAVGAFGELVKLRDDFVAQVVEGYPAAWNETTQILGNTLPTMMHGYADREGRKIQVQWRFERTSKQERHRTTYVASTVMLPDGAEGSEMAFALDELAVPRTRLIARPALAPIWGVKSYYNRERGRQVYPPEPLTIKLLGYVSTNTTRIRAGYDPDMVNETVLEKEDTVAAYDIGRIAHWFTQITDLMGSYDDMDDSRVEALIELCRDYIEEDITSPNDIVTYIDRNLLERYRQPRRIIDVLLEHMRQSSEGGTLRDCDFKADW